MSNLSGGQPHSDASDPSVVDLDPLAAAPPMMPAGSKYAGQPADITSRRSLALWSPQGGAPAIAPEDTWAVGDHFYHEGRFWRARFPLDGVEHIYGQAFNFSEMRTRVGKNGREVIFNKQGLPKRKIPFLYHVQSRIQLRADCPVELYPLGTSTFEEPVHRVTDFVYSLEALGPIGWDFDLKNGLGGHLIVAHRFMSTQDMVFERIVVENQYVTQSPSLPLGPAEKRELLVRSLERSQQAGMKERYYLYRCCGTNNCTSNPFRILDKVVKYDWRHRLGAFFYRLPVSPRFYLWIRGLDIAPGTLHLVRDEFKEFIEDPKIRQRKRDYVRKVIKQRREAEKAGGEKNSLKTPGD